MDCGKETIKDLRRSGQERWVAFVGEMVDGHPAIEK